MLLGLGLAVVILDYYRSTTSELLTPILAVLSLRFLDRPIRFLLFGRFGFYYDHYWDMGRQPVTAKAI
jgi:hypothetical protein